MDVLWRSPWCRDIKNEYQFLRSPLTKFTNVYYGIVKKGDCPEL